MYEVFIIMIVIMLVSGIAQIILFIKLWAMTNDVKTIKNSIAVPDPNKDIKEARLLCLSGDYENAIIKLQKSFIQSVCNLYDYTNEIYVGFDNYSDMPERDNFYKQRFDSLVSIYQKQMQKCNGKLLDTERFDSYEKIREFISYAYPTFN